MLIFSQNDDEDDFPGSFEAELAIMDDMDDQYNDLTQIIGEVSYCL